MTPFWANYYYNPPMGFKSPKAPGNMRSEILADATVSGMEAAHRRLRECMLEALQSQSDNAGGKNNTFAIGNQVWLSTQHFRMTRLSKQLN